MNGWNAYESDLFIYLCNSWLASRTQMQVIYANQIVSLIFFTLRGLGLYHSRRVIYQAFKLRTSRAANRHSLALRNRRYYPGNRSKTTDSLLRCRVKVRSRERQCSTMALAPFISSIKRHSLDERLVSRPRSALRPRLRTRKCSNDQSKSAVYSRRVLYLPPPDNHFSLFRSFFLPRNSGLKTIASDWNRDFVAVCGAQPRWSPSREGMTPTSSPSPWSVSSSSRRSSGSLAIQAPRYWWFCYVRRSANTMILAIRVANRRRPFRSRATRNDVTLVLLQCTAIAPRVR